MALLGDDAIVRVWYDHILSLMEDRIRTLKSGLDAESKAAVDSYVARVLTSLQPEGAGTVYVALDRFRKQVLTRTERRMDAEPAAFGGDSGELARKYTFAAPWQLRCRGGLSFLPGKVAGRLNGRVFVDGGAWIGDSLVYLMEGWRPSRVLCIEPHDGVHQALKDNIARWGWGEVAVPLHAWLGGKDGPRTGAPAGFSPTERTLDGLAEPDRLDIGLIKLDVEGAEYEVIAHSLSTIKRCKPLLLISIYHTPRDFFEIKPLIEGLGLGYTFMVRHLCTHINPSEYVLIGF
jgi:FkbM family methyltransferase